tara:strand:+ start:474 stop:860 length:387 start_codon:yes stop_codon:yes gene_type:complete
MISLLIRFYSYIKLFAIGVLNYPLVIYFYMVKKENKTIIDFLDSLIVSFYFHPWTSVDVIEYRGWHIMTGKSKVAKVFGGKASRINPTSMNPNIMIDVMFFAYSGMSLKNRDDVIDELKKDIDNHSYD